MILVEGKKYKVIENLGYIHSRYAYGKVIIVDGEERVVLKYGKEWRFAETIIEPVGVYRGQT